MESNYDSITFGLGITLFAIGFIIVVKKALIVRANKIIIGEIYDRRSGYKDHYYPVIKYDINNESREYQSSHFSVFQKIGNKMKLVYNEKEDRILGTFGEFFFVPVNIMIIGFFITGIMILYKISS